MPNTAYLACGIAQRIYPSDQEGDFDPAQQTVASSVLAIPMLWFTCFRPEDWMVATLKDEDGQDITVGAPVVERRVLQARLKDSLPRLESLFPGSGSFKSHAKAFRETIATVHHAYRFITIEWEEIAGMGDREQFDREAQQILKFMAGEDVPGVRELLVEISQFNPDRKLPSVSAIAKSSDLPVEDWDNLHSLAGGEFSRDVSWIPKLESKPEVVSEIVQAARVNDFARVWELIEAGTDLAVEDKDGKIVACLMNRMAHSGPTEETMSWLERFLGANATVNDHALATSASISSLATFSQLLKLNPNPNARDGVGFPAIVQACSSRTDALEKVKLLIEAGANPNERQSASLRSGSTYTFGVLDECVRRDLVEVAEYLVQQRIDPKFVERAYWEVRANRKGAIKDRWLQILEPHLN